MQAVAELRLAAFDMDPRAFARDYSMVVDAKGCVETTELYLEGLRASRRKPRYVKDVRRSLEMFLEHTPETIVEIGPEHLEDFLAGLTQLKASTVDKHWRRVTQLMAFAKRRDFIMENPVRKVRGPKLPRKSKSPRFILNTHELNDLKEHMDELFWSASVAMWSCGLRQMDVQNLKLSWIDFDTMTLRVAGSKNNESREVPIADDPSLRALVLLATEKPNETTFRMALAAAIKASGLDKKLTPHKLRDSAITRWVDEYGVGKAQQWAGHKNLETTLQYVHPKSGVTMRPTGVL